MVDKSKRAGISNIFLSFFIFTLFLFINTLVIQCYVRTPCTYLNVSDLDIGIGSNMSYQHCHHNNLQHPIHIQHCLRNHHNDHLLSEIHNYSYYYYYYSIQILEIIKVIEEQVRNVFSNYSNFE